MKWVVRFVGAVVALVLVVVGVGWLLPQSHRASVTATVDAGPEEVWTAITDVEGFPRWRSDVDRVERLEREGTEAAWVEHGPTGPLPMEVAESAPPTRLVARIIDDGLPFGGTWTYELSPAGSGTRLTLTEDGEVYNPFFRFVSRFVMGHERTMRRYLGDLTASLGGEVAP